jgi:amino acid adenylation domain-containing protein/FkbM family methyltransferase
VTDQHAPISASARRRAALLKAVDERRAAAPADGISRGARSGVFPLSFAQRRLWFVERLDPQRGRYNVPLVLRLRGALDPSALYRALAAVRTRHGALRTRFAERDGEPVQVVAAATADAVRLPVSVEELTGPAAVDRERDLDARLRAELVRPFDLTAGPPVRARLWRCAEHEHVLLIVLHHLVTDGWSSEVIVRELAALYREETSAKAPGLPTEPLPYSDYAAWQHKRLCGGLLEKHLDFWRRQLAGAPPTLELASDRPRRDRSGGPAGEVNFEAGPEVAAALGRLHREEGATLAMTVLAAYLMLLGRYSGQDDLVVGMPVANRARPELHDVVGFFTNMMPVRARIDGGAGFRGLIRQVKGTLLAAIQHEELPFEKLVEELRPGRVGHQHPVFQAVFSFDQPTSTGPVTETGRGQDTGPGTAAAGLEVTRLPFGGELAKFDLVCAVRPAGPRGLRGALRFDRALFDTARIERMAATFSELLAALAADPDRPLDQLTVLTDADRRLLAAGNDTAVPLPPEPVHRLIEQQARRTPEAPALVGPHGTVGYAALNDWADRVATRLSTLPLAPEALVAVHAERSPELVVGVLAALKAGAAFLALDPDQPEDRNRRILDEAAPAVVLTPDGRPPAAAGRALPAVSLAISEAPGTGRADSRATVPGPATDPGRLAYVVHTSGSTGRPKGAQNTHGGIANRLRWMQRTYPLTASDTVLHKTPTSFDVSVWELLWPLTAGARLALAAPGEHRDPHRLAALISEHRVTTVHFVPTVLRALLDLPDLPSFTGSLRRVICSGEALPQDLADRFFARLPGGVELHNLYGPAEAAIDVTAWPCRAEEDRASVPIGTPIDNTRVHVCDERMRPVPVGAPGELYLAGVGVGRGYLRRPDLTAERFVPDPFSAVPGERLYRTGDRVRMLPDGSLDFLGRVDRQIKIGGVRIEPGDIEAVLAEHPAVDHAVVVPDPTDSTRLNAYVVPGGGSGGPARAVLRLGPDAPVHRLPNGMEVLHHSPGETDFVYQEIFEEQNYLRHGIELGNDDCVFDIGANIGLFSLYVGQRWPGAQIFAVEPIPDTAELLRRNTELYGLNVRVLACGLSAEAGTAEFTHYPHLSIMSGRHAGTEDRARVRAFAAGQLTGAAAGDDAVVGHLEEILDARLRPVRVTSPLRTLSEILREHRIRRVDLLKIDVEKSEHEVLAGIADEDWPAIRQAVLEVHDIDGRLEQITGLLRRHGLHCVVEEARHSGTTGLFTVYARRERSDPGSARPVAPSAVPEPPPGPRALLAQLRAFTAERLPSAMRPHGYVLLPELPVSANGKTDIRALPRPGKQEWTAPVAPRTVEEALLLEIWEELLGGPIGVEDDFFELGGHSLLGIRLLAAVERRLGARLPVQSLFEGGNIARQAVLLKDVGARHSGPLVPIRRDGTRPPLFCVHPMGGTVFRYPELARCLGADQPFYALQALEPAGNEIPAAGVPDIAADYLTAARAVAQGGPWRLMGYSFGGLVAHEMACRLLADGEEVEMLSIVDALPARPDQRTEQSEAEVMAHFLGHHDALVEADLRVSPEELAAMEPGKRREAMLSRIARANLLPPEAGQAHVLRLYEVYRQNWFAFVRHRPRVYPGRTLLFKTGTRQAVAAAHREWSAWCTGPLEVVELPGTHADIFRRPALEIVAGHVGTASENGEAR